MGVREIVVNTAHLPNLFEDVLGDGQQYGVSLYYSREGESADDDRNRSAASSRPCPAWGRHLHCHQR